MAVDFDKELTSLTAEILRDAVQVYDTSDIERWAAGLAGFGAGDVTGSFQAVTGGFTAVTGSFQAVTGSFPSLTGQFAVVGQDADTQVTLKKVFRLPDRLPAVRLPQSADLARLARSAPMMTKLNALAGWLGRDGRLVDEDEDLSPGDAADAARQLGIRPEHLAYLWDYALTSGWVELADEQDGRTWAVIGETAWRWADGDEAGTLHVWAAVFASVLARALEVAAASDRAASRKLKFGGQGVVVAVMLFMARRAGMSRAEVRKLVMDDAIGERPSSRARRAWDSWVRVHGDPARLLLTELAALRAVTVPDTDKGIVGVTPLTQWALRQQFRLDGIQIQMLSATSPRVTAAELVALVDAVSDAEFEAEAASWIGRRGPDRGARELLAFAAFSGPDTRLAAVNLVRRIGIDAHRAWKDAMQRPELRGYARIALSMMAGDLPESTLPLVLDPDPEDLTWVATDLLALACGEQDPDPERIAEQFSDAIPPGEESWIFGLMAESSHAEVARLLTILARYHPDRQIAKDARRAARMAGKNRAVTRTGRAPARATAR
jgi:hypothetical protein